MWFFIDLLRTLYRLLQYTSMCPYPRSLIYRFAMAALLTLPMNVYAQSSVWTDPGGARQKTGKKTADARHKVKDLKDHLQKWGMDTSYTHTFLLGGKLNTDGWSGMANLMKKKGGNTNNVWQLSFSEIKHEKQTRLQGSNSGFAYLGNGTPFVYGKINNLYTLQIGFGKETLLLPAVMEGNISVSFRYTAGLSLAMLKPYYLKLVYVNYNGNTQTAHTEQQGYNRADSAKFLNTGFIQGASTWSKSLANITYVPGAYFDTALTIIPGKSISFIQEITLGINGAFYTQSLQIMADQKAYPWQVSLFAGLGIGKRWR